MIALVDSRKTGQRREPDKERTSNIGLFVTERFPAWAEALRPPCAGDQVSRWWCSLRWRSSRIFAASGIDSAQEPLSPRSS